jgi:hypothetical protein
LLGVGGALASVAAFNFASTSAERAVVKLIRDELHFLKLDEQGLQQFAALQAQGMSSKYRMATKGFALLGVDSSSSGRVAALVQTYLLSTDFFTHQMDESRTVRFVSLYNPYNTPCAHPFSSNFYPQQTA